MITVQNNRWTIFTFRTHVCLNVQKPLIPFSVTCWIWRLKLSFLSCISLRYLASLLTSTHSQCYHTVIRYYLLSKKHGSHWSNKVNCFFAESSTGENSHCQSLIRGCFRQQEEGSWSKTGRPRIGYRIGRKLQRRRHLRTATSSPSPLSGENDRPGICRVRSSFQRPSKKTRITITNGKSNTLGSLHRLLAVMLRTMLSSQVPADLRKIHASCIGSTNESDWRRNGRNLSGRGVFLRHITLAFVKLLNCGLPTQINRCSTHRNLKMFSCSI